MFQPGETFNPDVSNHVSNQMSHQSTIKLLHHSSTVENKTPTTLSAGFVFFSQPPNSNDWYFLLGFDDFSEKWSDFGGRRNSNESEIHCAVREMLEETMCVVQFPDCETENLDASIESISEMIRRNDFTFRIKVDVTSKSNCHHQSNSSLLAVHQVSSNLAQSLKHSCQQQRHHDNSREKRLRVCYVKYIPWQPDLPEVFTLTYKSLRVINTLRDVDSKLKYIKTLPEKMQKHPAITYEFENNDSLGDGCIPSKVHVHGEWLEKRQIAWWSLPRLQMILKNAGRHGGHIFKCGFLSTLEIIAQHFLHASRVKKQHDDEMRRKKNPFIYELEDYGVLVDVLKRALELEAKIVQPSGDTEFKITF